MIWFRDITSILENEMETKMDNGMETGTLRDLPVASCGEAQVHKAIFASWGTTPSCS